MSSRSDKEKLKQVQDKCQTVLTQLLRDEDNKYCVDCDAKGPRWASWNLGIFLCIRCAGIHRNLGVHISKVKSVNLDSWNPEQVTCLRQMGNSRARAVFEANLPDNFRRPQTDSALEAFIRAKYEQKRYIAKEWVPPPMPKPSLEFEEEKKKPKERKPAKPGGCEVPLPLNSVPRKNGSTVVSNSDSKVNDNKGKLSGTADLLGLNDPPPSTTPSDDPFGGFLSADTSVDSISGQASQNTPSNGTDSSKTTNNHGLSNQESLFSQLGGDDLQKKQQPLSKESILSLYGQTHSAPQQQQQPQMIGIPGPMYAAQQQQQQVPMFGIPGIHMQPVGYPNMPGVGSNLMGVPGAAMMTQVSQANLMGTNPFLNPGSCGAIEGWYTATNNPQPMFGQLNQQMSALSMGPPAFGGVTQQMPNPNGVSWSGQQPGQTLSNNLWQ